MLEDSTMWRNLTDDKNALKVKSENSTNELVWYNDMAIVSSKFKVGEEEGQIMVVGPSRMNYNRIVSVLDFATALIESKFKRFR